MRWPSSPGHGALSRPGNSFWNLTHITLRPLVLVDVPPGVGAEGPQESAMEKIVMDLAGGQHRQFGIDREDQACMSVAQRSLDELGTIATREDEPEVTR